MEDHPELSDDERVSRLAVYLGRVVQEGGEVVQHSGFGAVVLRRTKASVTSNLFMVAAGLALFGITMEPLFAVAALVAAFGWHRKIIAAARPRQLWVRVDELGRVRETELETA